MLAEESRYSTHLCHGGVGKCVWSATDSRVSLKRQVLTYNHYKINTVCTWIGNRTPSPLSCRAAGAELRGQCISFYKLRQGPGSCLEDVPRLRAPVAPGCFWSNNHIVLKVLKSLHKPMEVILQATSAPARWPWNQLCGHVWMCHHVGPEPLILPTATARLLSLFFPAVIWDGFPPL